jgi:biofilm PGA synthesis N-glycosyltransferase PgaC
MWLVGLEYWVSVLWCYAVAFTILCWAATNTLPDAYWPDALKVETLIPQWTGVALAVVCLTQFAVGLLLDSIYERRGLFRYLFWAIWYPAVYWFISAATTIVAVPRGLAKLGKTRHAVWVSPGRKLLYAPLRMREARKKPEHRNMFWRLVPQTQKYAEMVIMFISWSLWVYLIMPLLSVLVWIAGGYLFKQEMLSPGSVETFMNVLKYGSVILTMWVMVAAWILWNQRRYGRRNRRNGQAPVVSTEQIQEHTNLSTDEVSYLRSNREVYIHFDEEDRPVIDENVEAIGKRPQVAVV